MLAGKRRPSQLTPSHEHYLRALWEVRSRSGYARLVDVAHELGIAHATLSVGLGALVRRRLVVHDAHRFLVLTPKGERLAREVHHRHAVARAFLHDVLGVEADRADREACLLEHDLSAATTDRLVDLLRLLNEDAELRGSLCDRLASYHRSCTPGAACSTCGLSCVTPIP
jgi:Mn-dependent DtxR family transcriptional regulator